MTDDQYNKLLEQPPYVPQVVERYGIPKETKIGFTCGAFDLTHAGHYLMFEECKMNCDELFVGLQTNPHIDRPEKHEPIQKIDERLIQLSACKWIDHIIPYDTEADLLKILKDLKPDVRFLGEDHKGKPFTGDKLDIPIVWNSRNHTYSSSSIRERIYERQQRQ